MGLKGVHVCFAQLVIPPSGHPVGRLYEPDHWGKGGQNQHNKRVTSTSMPTLSSPWTPRRAVVCSPASRALEPAKPAAQSLLPRRSAAPRPSLPRSPSCGKYPTCTAPARDTQPAGPCCWGTEPRRSWNRCCRGSLVPAPRGSCRRSTTTVYLSPSHERTPWSSSSRFPLWGCANSRL